MIPDFLKRENQKKATEFDHKLHDALEKYEKHFGEDFSTEPLQYPPNEWIDIIDRCIAENKDQWQIFGEEYDPEADY